MPKSASDKPVSPDRSPARQAHWWVVLALFLGTLVLYWPVRSHDFVGLDDPDYVSENPMVNQGLSRATVVWALRANDASNWHPLTWLSHALDCQIFGLRPGAHHLVNVGLHATNAVLLFFLLRLATGTFWRAAFVAAVFAWHPLRVESVAWISERKDVLSACFGLLTLLAYVQYVRGAQGQGSGETTDTSPQTGRWYFASLALFACGLMSKPMLVTLPCLMLLLDAWPLGRLPGLNGETANQTHPKGKPTRLTRALRGLLVEKIPFFALSAISCALTVWAQGAGHAIGSTQAFPVLTRLANALVASGKYVEKTFWPANLAVFYPYPAEAPVLAAIAVGTGLLAFTGWLVWRWRRQPAAVVGWLWFLGMLVPVIGLVQVGGQAWADRYSYLPGIGLLLVIVWLWAECKLPRALSFVVAAVALLASVGVTRSQIGVWRNSETLFEHARAVTDRNYLAWTVLGGFHGRAGRLDEAQQHYETALQMLPDYAGALTGMGNIHEKRGAYELALQFYDRALGSNPHDAEIVNGRATVLARLGRFADAEAGFQQAMTMRRGYGEAAFNLAAILQRQGRLAEALPQFEQAVQWMPQSTNAHFGLAKALHQAQQPAAALAAFDRALQLAPDWSEPRFHRGLTLIDLGRGAEAVTEFQQLLTITTNRAAARDGLGFALAIEGRGAEAETHFQAALAENPRLASAHLHYAMLLAQRGEMGRAVSHYRAALDTEPNQPAALNNLAWLLATHPDDHVRHGADAVKFAQRACELTAQREPFFLGTLAAAHAEVGDFPAAVAAAQRAIEIARQAGRPDLAQRNEELLKQYQNRQPYRDLPRPPQ